MKKLALTSLLAVFAFTGTHAANVIDGNPLYMPKAGHFYSVTSVGSHTESEPIKTWAIEEEFGYGITDKLGITVSTSLSEYDTFDEYSWDETSLQATFRALDMGAWKLDLVGSYGVDTMWGYHEPFLDKGETRYGWLAGVRGGYTTANWTVAGHAYFSYLNSESFNWNDEGLHAWLLGLDGQYLLDSHWGILAGVEYTGFTDSGAKNAGSWSATLGVNYNIDATKFVGAYISGDMDHKGGHDADEWDIEKGFGFGAKFGIDF